MLLRRALITCGRMLIRAQSSRTACYCLLDYFFPARMESTGTEWLPRGNKHAHSGVCLGCADVPQQRAAAMTLGVVAGRARGALVDACAAYRARDSQARAWAPRHANAHLPPIQARGVAWVWVAVIAHVRAPCPGVRQSAWALGRGRIGYVVGAPAVMTGRGGAAARAQEAVFQLLRLAGLLDALPLPPGSAQAEMVAAGLSQRATLPEREARRPTKHPLSPQITLG